MGLAVIKMISQVYYRHNLLIRNRNWVSMRPGQPEPDLIHSNEIFLLPFKLIFYLQQIFAAWFRLCLWPLAFFFWLTYFLFRFLLVFVSISIPLNASWSHSPIAWLSGILVVNQKISCWHRFVIFLMTDTRWVLSVSLVIIIVFGIVCPPVCLWSVAHLVFVRLGCDECLNWFRFRNVIYIFTPTRWS